jgi:trehalose synthase
VESHGVRVEDYERFVGAEAVGRILTKAEALRGRMGRLARETVRRNFLLTRYLEQHRDLDNSFEASFRLRAG